MVRLSVYLLSPTIPGIIIVCFLLVLARVQEQATPKEKILDGAMLRYLRCLERHLPVFFRTEQTYPYTLNAVSTCFFNIYYNK